jgi:hypothetical protein
MSAFPQTGQLGGAVANGQQIEHVLRFQAFGNFLKRFFVLKCRDR